MDKDYLPATCSKTSHRPLCELRSRFKLENGYIRTISRFSFAFGFLHKREIVLNSIYRGPLFDLLRVIGQITLRQQSSFCPIKVPVPRG